GGTAAKMTIANDALGKGFLDFLRPALINLLSVTKGTSYVCMSSSEWPTLHRAWQEAGGKWSSTIIWAKNTFALGRADYHQQFEAMLYGWKAGAPHYWCGARDQGNVWHFDKPARNDLHPTMKPVALVERAIRNSSKPRDTVLDCFGGSGTTMIAAERTGRRAVLLEIDPAYCDVILQRWQEETGKRRCWMVRIVALRMLRRCAKTHDYLDDCIQAGMSRWPCNTRHTSSASGCSI
ncbi:MAG: DNA-methyltransferase, partial [bacterium]